MTTRKRCANCDKPIATNNDFDRHDGSCRLGCPCFQLCWRNWNSGAECHATPIDWRGRALRAEAKLRKLERK